MIVVGTLYDSIQIRPKGNTLKTRVCVRYTAIRQLEVKTKWIFILMTTSSPFPFIFFFQTFKILQLIFCFPEISLESLGNYISIMPRQGLCELTDQRVLGFSQPTGGPETGETPCQSPFLVIATIPHHRSGDNPVLLTIVIH